MNDNYSGKDGENADVLVGPFFKFLRSKVWLLVVLLALSGLIAIAYSWIQKPKYEAVTTFILEEKSGGGSGISALASQFGFNLGSLGAGGSIFAGDNILDILKSKKIVTSVLLSPIDSSRSDALTIADVYLNNSALKKKVEEKHGQLKGNFSSNGSNESSPLHDSILNVIYTRLIKDNITTEKLSRQSTIIRVSVVLEDALLARLISERLVQQASSLYLSIRLGNQLENISSLQRRSDSLLALLNGQSYFAARSQPLDANPGVRVSLVPVEIVNRNKAILGTVYAEVTKNLEASKLLLAQQTPVIQILDTPTHSPDDNKKGLFVILGVTLVACLFLFVAGAYFVFFIKDAFKQKAIES